MKHKDVTIVMQGPLVSIYDGSMAEGLQYLDNYLNLVDRIIISTWENSVGSFIDNADKIIGNRNITLVTEDIAKYDDYYKNANVVYQAASSLNGLKKVDTEYAIKLRCDEYYTDLSRFIDLMKSAPEKLTTSNLLFCPDIHEQFHPSDHIAGGYTKNILGMYQTAVDFCRKFPAGTDPIHCSQLGIEGYSNVYDNGLVAPEAFLCICFLMNKGVDIDCSQSVKIMKEHVQFIPLCDMGQFLCRIKGYGIRDYESFLYSPTGQYSVANMEEFETYIDRKLTHHNQEYHYLRLKEQLAKRKKP